MAVRWILLRLNKWDVVRPQLVPAPLRPLLPEALGMNLKSTPQPSLMCLARTSNLITRVFFLTLLQPLWPPCCFLLPQGLCLRSSHSVTFLHGPCPHFAQVSIWRPSSSETGLCTSLTVCPHFSLITYPSYNIYLLERKVFLFNSQKSYKTV